MKTRFFFVLFCFWIVVANSSNAQINRPYEPIVITGETLSDLPNLEIEHLFLFAYDAGTGTWKMIPFQIDEVNPNVEDSLKYFEAEDSLGGLFDADDELVFMASDLGDRADSLFWASNTDTIRYELKFIDPLDNSIGYVYLYYSNSIIDPIPNYYEMTYDSVNDRVSSMNYELGFIERGGDDPNETGQLNDVIIKSGSGEDIFDRLKIRAIGWWLLWRIYLDEETIEAKYAYAKIGPVRIIRNMAGNFFFETLNSVEPFTQTVFFYPWSGSFELVDIPLGEAKEVGAQVFTVRVSWDLNSRAQGMKFYSEFNSDGFPINGRADNIDESCKPGELNWTMVTGNQGTIVNAFHIPDLGDITRLYYFDYDSTEGVTGDDPGYFSYDTGDLTSFGDNGFSLDENIQNYIDNETVFNFYYHNYFLPPNFSSEEAATICEQIKNPLNYSSKFQIKYTLPAEVSESKTSPLGDFSLIQNYPNPFNTATTISFTLAKKTYVKLQIYDSLGRLVTTIENRIISVGSYKYLWAGQNSEGIIVPSGIYLCKLTTKEFSTTKKLLLIK